MALGRDGPRTAVGTGNGVPVLEPAGSRRQSRQPTGRAPGWRRVTRCLARPVRLGGADGDGADPPTPQRCERWDANPPLQIGVEKRVGEEGTGRWISVQCAQQAGMAGDAALRPDLLPVLTPYRWSGVGPPAIIPCLTAIGADRSPLPKEERRRPARERP